MNKPPNVVDDMEFEDGEGFRSKAEGVTIKTIVLKQYEKCCTEGSKEMTGGGVINRIINGQLIELAVPNQREIFINSVEMLNIVLIPEIKKNKKLIQEDIDKFEYSLQKLNINLNEYMQQIDSNITFDDPRYKQHSEAYYKDKNISIQNLHDNYELAKVELYKSLLRTIGMLLNHLNYFEEESFMSI